jgi:hypothetical protein
MKTSNAPPSQPAQARPNAQGAEPAADCEIPEINTNFMDNLFQDDTFLNRFDAAFGATVPMGLEADPPSPARPGKQGSEVQEVQNLLDIDFERKPGQ